MPKCKKTKKFAAMKRMISAKDARIKKNQEKNEQKQKQTEEERVRRVPQVPSSLFFQYNDQLGPPYHILVDTNFINFSIKNKLDMMQSFMDCLYAKCVPCVTDCVMGELEKLGSKFRVAQRIVKDARFERLPCMHAGTYADDCLVNRVTQHRCYIVATCDRDLKRRVRKIPGVPIMYITQHRYSIERMPDAYGVIACTDGDLRLTGGPNELEGRLEYCKSSTWGNVCGSSWDRNDALVVCRQLGFESSVSSTSYYGAQEGPAFINNINCVAGTEATLDDCGKQEIESTGCSSLGGFAYLVCQDPNCSNRNNTVTLVEGESDSVGRVEVCDSSGYRRQVCQNGWSDQDAIVVCRNLGFQNGTGAMAFSGYELGTVRLPAFNNIGCSGNEQYFIDCSQEEVVGTFPVNTCPGFAGVRCLEMETSTTQSTDAPTTQPRDTPTTQQTGTPTTQQTDASTSQQTDTLNTQQTDTPATQQTDTLTTEVTAVSPTLSAALVGGVAGGVGGSLLLVIIVLVIVCVLVCLLRKAGHGTKNVESKPVEAIQHPMYDVTTAGPPQPSTADTDAIQLQPNALYAVNTEPDRGDQTTYYENEGLGSQTNKPNEYYDYVQL